MNPRNKFWWFAAVSIAITLIILSSLFILFWHHLSLEEKSFLISITKQHFLYIFSAVFLMLAGLGFALDAIFNVYIIPTSKLVEETTLINSVNPSHRIKLEGSEDIMRLAQIINEGADRFEELQKNIDQKINLAKSKAMEEKNMLAAIMSELPEGLVICNAEGRIILYSKKAKEFLTEANTIGFPGYKTESGSRRSLIKDQDRFVGLGRSIFNVIDKNLITHSLDEIADQLKHKQTNVASYFVIVGKWNKLLRAEVVPVLSHLKKFTGFIIIFNDISQQIETDRRINSLFQSLTKSIRSSLTGIRSTIEAILEYPDMDKEQLEQFRKIIHKESIILGDILDKTVSDYSINVKTQWPLFPMLDSDLACSIKTRAAEKLGLIINIEKSDEQNWIKVDTYSIIFAMLFVLNKLKSKTEHREFTCKLERNGQFINFDYIWQGDPVKIETLRAWSKHVLIIKNEEVSMTLKEVISHNNAEIWSHSCDNTTDTVQKRSYLRLLLPAVETFERDNIRNITILPESRPEFYDFDMFNQPGQSPEMDDRLLAEITFAVFDTETTGLDPAGGDKIISIASVRVVNGRLLQDECFDQFVDPERSLPFESTQIHGIQPEMLKGRPTIDKVLPLFDRFVEDMVLVAHNAAFDMRMLQIYEAKTGVKFINPVLDTLLLSAVVHPVQQDHTLEAIAGRLGVSIVGRHTALGDAIATGEIFIKLIPLLAKMGIYTLKEARKASRKTYYSRIKY